MAISSLDGGSLPSSFKPKRSSGPTNQQRQRRSSPPQRRSSPPRQAPTPRPAPPRQVPSSSSPGPVQSVSEPSPKPPGIKKFLAGDEVYQQAVRGGKRTLSDFLSDLTRRETEAGTQFEQTQEQMELDRVRQLEQMKDEFASRGLIHSGLFAREQGDFQEDFQTQMQQLDQANTQLLADIMSQRTNARREQELALEAARQDALARRADRFKIGI